MSSVSLSRFNMLRRFINGQCILAVTTCVLAGGQAQTVSEKIKATQKDLDVAIAKRADLANQKKTMDQKVDDIAFAADAWKKQSAVLDQELSDLKTRWAVLSGKIDQHNAHQCTEKCTSAGKCDGSCDWYNKEGDDLDHQSAGLEAERKQLTTNAGLLDQIKANVKRDIEELGSKEKQWGADNEANEAQIARLEAILKSLKDQSSKAKTVSLKQ